MCKEPCFSRHLVVAVGLLCLAAPGLAVEIGPGDDLEAAVANLSPGEELVLRGGTYFFDENITLSVSGTAAQPIVVRAKDGERPVFEQATDNHNVVDIRDSSYVVYRGIEFKGGSQGIRLSNANFITIEDCEVHETADVAISANAGGTYEGLRLLRNHIHHTDGTGEGMYLGCNNDACRIANSLIEGNYIHHTNRATVEQGDGIEIKEGSYGNIVRNNVIHDTNYPGILLYSTVGNGAPNVVEGNVVWNVADNTMQIAADAIVRNNIILGNVSFQAHQAGSPSNLEFVHNTVISDGNAIDVRNVSGPVLIANNAVYAQGAAINLISGDLGQVQLVGNVTGGSSISSDFVGAHFNGAPPIDVFPAPGGALIGAGDVTHVSATDFNGTPRNGVADAGAYAFDPAGNPGWVIGPEFKGLVSGATRPMPPADLRTD